MIRWRSVLGQNSNHASNVKVFQLELESLEITVEEYLIYHLVKTTSCESCERHLVIFSREDRCDLTTDGFKPLMKMFT